MAELEYDCSQIQDRGEVKTLAAFAKSLEQNYFHEDRKAEVWQFQDDFEQWLSEMPSSKKRQTGNLEEAIARVNRLIEIAQQRLEEIDQMLEEIETIEQAIQQAEIASKGMEQQELFSRYQRNINRELYEALDRLEAIQQRKNGGSMGSFGQSSDCSTPIAATDRQRP
jgi:uncharacterized protein YoxC